MKSKAILIRLTPEEKKKLSEMAARENKNMSAFILHLCELWGNRYGNWMSEEKLGGNKTTDARAIKTAQGTWV